MTKGWKNGLLVALVAALVAGNVFVAVANTSRLKTFQYDFVAFYCAGQVANEGRDPYLTEPLRTCEHRVGQAFRPGSKLAIPVPIPGYVLPLFQGFGHLPFAIADALWIALQLVVYALAVYALVRLTGLSPPVVMAATLLSVLFVSLILGQLVPLAVAALVFAAHALERNRPRSAALLATLATIEPHLALPALAALFALAQRTRKTLLLCGGLLLGLQFCCAGLRGTVEYVTAVLPAQVRAELHNEEQYSASYAAVELGAQDQLAERIGTVSYALAALLGIGLAGALARRRLGDGSLVLIPPAVVLFGGPYLHIQHIGAAVPAALWLYARAPEHRRRLAAFAVLLLAIPWGAFVDLMSVLPLVALATAILARDLLRLRFTFALALGALAACAVVTAMSAFTLRPPADYSTLGGADAAFLAERSWRVLIDTTFHGNVLLFTLARIPTWLGLAILIALGAQADRGAGRGQDFEVHANRRTDAQRTTPLNHEQTEVVPSWG